MGMAGGMGMAGAGAESSFDGALDVSEDSRASPDSSTDASSER